MKALARIILLPLLIMVVLPVHGAMAIHVPGVSDEMADHVAMMGEYDMKSGCHDSSDGDSCPDSTCCMAIFKQNPTITLPPEVSALGELYRTPRGYIYFPEPRPPRG